MRLYRNKTFARIGLLGNPSDGYEGKSLSATIRNFWASVVLYEWDQVEIITNGDDRNVFSSVSDLVTNVAMLGYYGGVRLIKATIKKFVEFCELNSIELHDRNFSVRCESNIPRQVGLAGSSAIVISTLRCLQDFYDVQIPSAVLPTLALSVENDELGISAGLQDRVVQVLGGLVYMNFAKDQAQTLCGLSHGLYANLDPTLLPPMFLAYNTQIGSPTEVLHNDLRERYNQGSQNVVKNLEKIADIAKVAYASLLTGSTFNLHSFINQNYDLRKEICKIPKEHDRMVEVAREIGLCAKFTGSGGAIVGVLPNKTKLGELETALGSSCAVISPILG